MFSINALLQNTFAVLLVLASASPTSRFNKRDDAGVYICSDVNWGGNCVHYVEPAGGDDCVTLNGTASSISPDPGF